MSMPLYSANRTNTSVEVFVTRNGARTPLRHLLRHSVDGFEWGYVGSGPNDLARSILGDYLGVDDPADMFVRAVEEHLLASARHSGWTITPPDLHDAMRQAVAEHGPLTLGNVSISRSVDVQLRRDPTGMAFIDLCLVRHHLGDWGDLDTHDQAANTSALRSGDRLLSNYPIPAHVAPDVLKDDKTLWIITEAVNDSGRRTQTTLLYPSNY